MNNHFLYRANTCFQSVRLEAGTSSICGINDLILKIIPRHNRGFGSVSNYGIVLNKTLDYKISLLFNGKPLIDSKNNIVYGRLFRDSVLYIMNTYITIKNIEYSYIADITYNLEIEHLLVVDNLNNLPWNAFEPKALNVQGPQGIDGLRGEVGIKGILGLKGSQGLGLQWTGPWINYRMYNINDVVKYLNNIYICIKPNSNSKPMTSHYWDIFI